MQNDISNVHELPFNVIQNNISLRKRNILFLYVIFIIIISDCDGIFSMWTFTRIIALP